MARRPIRTEEQRAEFIPNYRPYLNDVPIPQANICDYPSRSYCINDEWMTIIHSALLALDQPDVWDSTDDDDIHAARQNVRSLLSMAAPLCVPPPAFGAGSPSCDTLLALELQQIFDADGLDGIAPDRPDTFFDDDSGDDDNALARRRVALCLATHDFITSIVKGGILQQVNIDPVFPVVTVFFAFIAFGVLGLVFGGASLILIELMNQFISGEDDVDLVACCMFEGMTGQAVTQANFQASLDACPDLGDAGANAIRNLVRNMMDIDANWFAFVRVLGSFMTAVDDQTNCHCTEDTCFQDFEIDNGNWTIVGGNAFYDDGVGWESAQGGSNNHLCHIDWNESFDFSIGIIRFQVVNTEPTVDIDVRIRLTDEFGTHTDVFAVLAQGEQSIAIVTNGGIAARRLLCRFVRDGLETELKLVLKKVEILSGDCILDEQPV